jgi:hypothetical protein
MDSIPQTPYENRQSRSIPDSGVRSLSGPKAVVPSRLVELSQRLESAHGMLDALTNRARDRAEHLLGPAKEDGNTVGVPSAPPDNSNLVGALHTQVGEINRLLGRLERQLARFENEL